MAPVINRDTVMLGEEELRQSLAWLSTHQEKFLMIPEIGNFLAQINARAAAEKGEIRSLQGGRAGTVEHNLGALQGGIGMNRGSQLLFSIRADNFVWKNSRHLRVLIVGPRDESEIFTWIGFDFDKRNIIGLDLISYSDFVSLGDMHKIPFEDDHFDIAVLSHCLNYTHQPIAVCAEITRVLRDGGVAVIGDEYTSRAVVETSQHLTEKSQNHWVRAADLEALFGSSFGETIFRTDPVPPFDDAVGKRLVAAFRIKKHALPNRVVDSFFDEIAALELCRAHLAKTAEGVPAETRQSIDAQFDAHETMLRQRRLPAAAPALLRHNSIVTGGSLETLLGQTLRQIAPPALGRLLPGCPALPSSLFAAHPMAEAGEKLAREGWLQLAGTLSPALIERIRAGETAALTEIMLDPWILELVENHLHCVPVVLGRREFRPEQAGKTLLAEMRLFLVLEAQEGAFLDYASGSQADAATSIPLSRGKVLLIDGNGLLSWGPDFPEAADIAEIGLANSCFGAPAASWSVDDLSGAYQEFLLATFPRLFQPCFLKAGSVEAHD
jgi:SAM-dependent methyltransferase